MSDPKPKRARDVVVRPMTADDVDALVDLASSVAVEGKWIAREAAIPLEEGRSHLTQFIDSDDGVLFVAESDGELIGNLSLAIERDGTAGLGMLVADGWRGRGVGTALVAAGVAWAEQSRAHKVGLEVWPHNEAAVLALYRRFGFVEEGRRIRHYRRENGELWDAIVMGLVLDTASPGSPY